MAFGTIYTREGNPRTTAILAVAKANGLELDFEPLESATEAPAEYLELNPVGKIPTFVRHDGFILTECIAISLYMTGQDPKTTLLGSSLEENATIIRWMSFINHELYGAMGGWFLPLIGRAPYNQASVESHIQMTEKRMHMIEQQLALTKYLAGNELTLVDLFGCGMLSPAFSMFFDEKWRAYHPRMTEWVNEVYHHPIYQAVAPRGLVMCKNAIPNEPLKDPSSYAR